MAKTLSRWRKVQIAVEATWRVLCMTIRNKGDMHAVEEDAKRFVIEEKRKLAWMRKILKDENL